MFPRCRRGSAFCQPRRTNMGLYVRLFVILAWSLEEAVAAQPGPASPVLYECNKTSIHLVIKTDPWGTGLRLNPQHLQMGTCLPSSESPQQGLLHFQYAFKACGFARLTSGTMVEYSADLVYRPLSSHGRFYARPFSERINCTDYEAQRLVPAPVASVTGQLSASSGLMFSGTIMKEDFSAPSDSTVFFLGSQIHIEFAAKSFLHRPLRVFVDECVAAPTPELHKSPSNYTVIANHGCLLDSRVAESRFLPRRSPDVIHLSLQAFEFVGVDSEIYLHCQVLVWDPDVLTDPIRKACSYHRDINRWENLDDPSSSVCRCCDSECHGAWARPRRDLRASPAEADLLQSNVVVRRLVVQKPTQNAGSYAWGSSRSLAARRHKGRVQGALGLRRRGA
nr:zona pellucida sperm-binding protein 3-like isoform X3 [Pogona vitticeps]